MGSIKLEYNKQSIIIFKVNNFYQIKDINQWIFLTKFSKAFLIVNYPNGFTQTPIDKKFVYNQDFELVNDLDFEFRFILPLGNSNYDHESYPHGSLPFTGTFNGNNFSIKNINIINTNSNGLFGIIKSGVIKNLTLENIVIQKGNDNGGLVCKAFGCEIENVNIIGNILISGKNAGCFSNYFEGNIKKIHICLDGILESKKRALVSNGFFGNIENVSIITNLKNSPGMFNIINGKLRICSLISFHTINKPFYEETKYHQINSCYYFQLNEEELPPIQNLYSCYYRNLNNNIIWSNEISSLGLQNWIKLNSYHYLKSIINYSNENINQNQDLKEDLIVYDLKSNFTNGTDIIIKNNMEFSVLDIKPFDKDFILGLCQKMEKDYYADNFIKQKITERNNKNNLIKIKSIRYRFSDESINLQLSEESLESSVEVKDCYETDSDTENSIEDFSNEIFDEEPIHNITSQQISLVESMILEELKLITTSKDI
jgi:hypothetical protein